MNRVDLEVWKILRTEASSSQNNIDKLRQHIEALRPETAFLSERIAAVKRNKSHHLSIIESYIQHVSGFLHRMVQTADTAEKKMLGWINKMMVRNI